MVLSLIIPVYNVEKYIGKTLSSIYKTNKLLDKFEVIIVNDGTKDDSMSIVSDFSKKYANMRIINQENQGLSAARNAGLKTAVGKYVWFVDSDDWIVSGAIDKICSGSFDSDVYLFKLKHYDEDGNEVDGWSDYEVPVPATMDGVDVIINNYPYTPMQEFLIKRDVIERNGLCFLEGIYHEDQEFSPKCLINAEKVTLLPDYFYCYLRRSSGSIMSSNSIIEKRKSHILIILNEYKQMWETCHDSRIKRALAHCCYDVTAGLFNGMGVQQYRAIYNRLGLKSIIPFCKKIVFKDDSHKRTHLNIVKRVLFMINPIILIWLKKTI